MRNVLSVAQAVVRLSFTSAENLSDVQKRCEGRLQALANAMSLLTASDWKSVSFRNLINEEFLPFAERIAVTGPDIPLKPRSAQTFSLLLAAMATVSLLVGGIGIMNVMLVSVTERTREIGVRMAIGAAPADIVAQFLLESILISAGGGLLGVVTGVLFIPLAAMLNQGMALLEPASIPLAFGVALLTGILFGLYPALRAARLDPIESLRYE